MTNAAIRAQLHHYIDEADDAKLATIYSIIKKSAGSEKYTPAELAEFYSRLEKHNSGETPSFSVQEAHEYVRQNKKTNDLYDSYYPFCKAGKTGSVRLL